MLQPILTLPSGTELKGGSPGSAVKSLTLHTAVNAGQEFTIGSAFSDYIEAEIWADPGGSLQITAGDALTYYRQDDAGNRTKVGVFYAEKPTRTKRNSYKVTAYDTMSKLDADFSGWLRANQAPFPKTIWQLVQLACQRAGVTLASSSLPINGNYSVQAFYADDLTCPNHLLGGGSRWLLRPHECRRQAAILDLHRQAQHGQNHSGRCQQQHRLLC